MIDYLVQTLKFNHLPVFVSGPGDIQNLLSWNVSYQSFTSQEYSSQNSYPEIVFHFPLNPLLLQQYKILTSLDVFPVEWSILISNNGKYYEEIEYKTFQTCIPDLQTKLSHDEQYGCKIYQLNSFTIQQKVYYAKFIKFVLKKNSYYEEDNNWRFLLHINGLEFSGLCSITTKLKLISLKMIIIFIPLILIKFNNNFSF